MSDVAVRTPMQYLDKAVGALRDVGLMPAKVEPAPINALLEQISDLEPEKIQVIARTLGQASVFNEVVREQIAGMEIGERYKEITDGFNSIRDDAKTHGRPARRQQARHDRARDQRLDEDLARRHRRPLRQDQRDLSRRHQGHQGPDRPRAHDPRSLPRLPRRAEAGRGAGARGAEDRNRQARRASAKD